MGHEKADYQFCSPNDHCNCGQSTNDVYPTSIRLALIRMNAHLIGALTGLISAFRYKAEEYADAIKMGKGAKPTATDKVKVHYHGTLTDGTVFDSSVDRGEPVTFALNQVIPGWSGTAISPAMP